MDSSKKPSSFGPTVAMMSKVTLGIEIANSFPLGIHDGSSLSIEHATQGLFSQSSLLTQSLLF